MMKFIEMKKSGVSFEDFSKNEKYEDVFEEFKIEVRELKRKSLFSYIEKECKKREIDEHYFIINNGFLIDDFAETYDADLKVFTILDVKKIILMNILQKVFMMIDFSKKQ